MAQPAKVAATYQDVLDAPPDRVAELVEGVLHVAPRPAMPHAMATSALGHELGQPFHRGRGGPGGWLIVDEPEVHFGADVLVPDLAGWRRERMPVVPRAAYVTVVPDWICEALLPSTERWDRTAKMEVYAREGVGHAWLLNADQQLLEVYRLAEGAWLRVAAYTGASKVRAVPFEAIELDLATLWADVAPA